MNVADLLEGRSVCVCAGSGGVGKTTTAAAIALGAAARGATVAVVTIDPARRLADALGLDELDNEPRRVDPARLAGDGAAVPGELWAMTLDPKRTFDELIDELAPSAAERDAVLANRIYRELSGAVAGAQEFTAIAKLDELHRSGRFDLIVLDTPPSRNALDFVDAPERLTHFFEGRALQALLRPTGLAARVMGRGTSVVFSVLRRITGIDLLEDLATFFGALGGMLDGFRERARRVERLLRDPATAFVLVTSPEREPIDEGLYFRDKLADAGIRCEAAIVNRVHHDQGGEPSAGELHAALDGAVSKRLAAAVRETFAEYHALARRDGENIARLRDGCDGTPLLLVPYLDLPVHDVAGLREVAGWLYATDAERAARIDALVA